MGCEQSNLHNHTPQLTGIRNENRKNQKIHGRASGNIQVLENVAKTQEKISSADEQKILSIINNHFFFSNFSTDRIKEIIKMMAVYSANKNDYVFQQGQPGFLFFIIKQGKVTVEINKKKVKTLEKGMYFGELSLLYTASRSASIKAKQNCVFWCLHQIHFRSFSQKLVEKNYKIAKPLISKLPLFQFMTKKQLTSIAYCVNIEHYCHNEVIFKEGDDANALYIILEGQVNVNIPGKNPIWLNKGQGFGQNSLRKNQLRSGTATSGSSQTTLISISRQKLTETLGGKGLSEIIEFNVLRWGLVRSNIFRYIPADLIPKIRKIAEIQEYTDNQIILRKKQPVREFLISIEGKINDEDAGKLINEEYFLNDSAMFNTKGENDKKKELFVCKETIKKRGKGKVIKINIKKVQEILGFDIMAVLKEKERLFSPGTVEFGHKITVRIPGLKSGAFPQEIEKIKFDELKFLSKLGEGQFGQVFLVQCPQNRKYALKCIKKKAIIEYGMDDLILSEKNVLIEIKNHPLIVSYLKSFKDEAFIYFLLEYIEGMDFFDALRKIGLLSQQFSRFYTACIIIAIEQLHSKSIVYRDLKPQNAIVDKNGYLRLIDMGAAKKLSESNGYRTFTVIGTPHYMAPEVIDGKGYSLEVDIWSIGIMLFEMVCGYLPFGENEEDGYEIYRIITEQKMVKFPKFYKNEKGKALIERLLKNNPSERSIEDFSALKSDAFFQELDWGQLMEKKAKTPFKPKTKQKKGTGQFLISQYLQKQIMTHKVSKKKTPWDKHF